jgi:hypothetical protein
MTRRLRICAACGRPFEPELKVNGPVRQRVVEIIANRPGGITRAELMNALYGDRDDGGPDDPHGITVMIALANRQLRTQGYHITSARPGRGGQGEGGRFRLVKIATAAERNKNEPIK